MKDTIYTIGYSGFRGNVERFIDTLKNNQISVLIDVRSVAYSANFPEYNKDSLSKLLSENNIIYRNYAENFGAKQNNSEYFTAAKDIVHSGLFRFDGIAKTKRVDKEPLTPDDMIIDYDKFIKSDIFKAGVEKIKTILENNYTPVLMCSEKDPYGCHRNIMISQALYYDYGYQIKHICFDKNDEIIILDQKNIEDKLISEFGQPSLLGGEDIRTLYQRKNLYLGWKINARPDPYQQG